MKLLIAYDGSESADAAINDLARAGLPADGTALVLTVTEVYLPPPPPSAFEIIEEARHAHDAAELERLYLEPSVPVVQASETATRARQRLARSFPGWTITAEGNYGSPASEIVRHADEWNPDLIVVGSHGRSPLGRFMLGSVSQKVLTEASKPVRIGRCQPGVSDRPLRLIVGIDGSASSELALTAVCSRSWPVHTQVRVVIVDDPLGATLLSVVAPPVQRWIDETNQGERNWARKLVETAAGRLREAGLNAEPFVCEGDPKKVLVAEAEQWQADAIFVGSTGVGSRIGRFVLGSVSAAVAARADCSVEVVRAPNKKR